MDFPETIREIHIYNCSFGTRELGPALYSTLRNIFRCPEKIMLSTTLLMNREDILYILICPAGFNASLEYLPKYFIGWQLEDMVNYPMYRTKEHYLNLMKRALYMWDYSYDNLAVVNEITGIKEVFLPLGYTPTISSTDLIKGDYTYTDQGKDVDVAFLGYCEAYPRRIAIRNAFLAAGLKIWFVSDFDLNGMRNVIRRSKICINMLAQDKFLLATVRLNILISNQACIVSEYATDNETMELYGSHGIKFVDYNNLVNACVQLLPNFNERKRMALSLYSWYKHEREWYRIVDFNAILPSLS